MNNGQLSIYRQQRGFTLIEMVTVIILLSVLSVGISSFIGGATQTFVNASKRDELVSSARFSVERLNREVREALPNSARVLNFSGGISCLEFVPIIGSSLFIDLNNEIDIDEIQTIKFLDERTSQDYSCNNACGDSVVIYPLNADDVYAAPNQTSGQVFSIDDVDTNGGADAWTLELVNTVALTNISPTERLFIVGQPIRFCEDNNQLFRITDYNLSPDLAASAYPAGSSSVLMAENIEAQFTVTPASLVRNSVVQISLDFFRDDDENERIVFDHEVHIINTP